VLACFSRSTLRIHCGLARQRCSLRSISCARQNMLCCRRILRMGEPDSQQNRITVMPAVLFSSYREVIAETVEPTASAKNSWHLAYESKDYLRFFPRSVRDEIWLQSFHCRRLCKGVLKKCNLTPKTLPVQPSQRHATHVASCLRGVGLDAKSQVKTRLEHVGDSGAAQPLVC